MNRNTLIMLTLSMVAFGCEKDGIDVSDIPDDTITGSLAVDIGGDATRDGGNEGEVSDSVSELWLRIDEVSVLHETEGWVFIDSGRLNVDLMAERDGASELIGEGDVYVGLYETLRLAIVDSWIVVDGEEYDLTIGTGIELDEVLDFDTSISVEESTSATVWLGWDLDNQLEGSGESWTLGTDVNLTVDVEQ